MAVTYLGNIEVILETVPVTLFEQNCTLLGALSSDDLFVVDPGGDADVILRRARALKRRIGGIFLTHAHLDHAGGVSELERTLTREQGEAVPIYAHALDRPLRETVSEQASWFGLTGTAFENVREPDVFVEDNAALNLAGLNCKALFTPGHAPGHLALYIDPQSQANPEDKLETPVLIAGDTVFRLSIGRTDLPGADHQTLLDSIHQKIMILPDNTRVLPGHGPETSVGFERKNNPFLAS